MQLNKLAFTLIELLVVIAIIGILSGLIVVSMSGVNEKANIAKVQVFSNSLKNSLMLNLVSEWKFDEGSGTSTIDNWQSRTDTITGGSWKTESNCVHGACLEFNTTSDYIFVGNNITMDLSNGYTLEAWVRYNSIPAGVSLDSIMMRRASNDAGWFIFCYRNTADAANLIYSYIEYTNASDVTQSMAPGAFLVPEKWTHLVVSVESNGTTKFYVNGVISGTPKYPTNFKKLGGLTATNTSSFYIARTGWGSGLKGSLDDVRIYTAPILGSQIKERYLAGLRDLLSKGGITKEEYAQRIGDLARY